MFNVPPSLHNRSGMLAALVSLFSTQGAKPPGLSRCQTQFYGTMRRNPLKLPGNHGNNAGRRRPHQGARECARRRGELKRGRCADAA